MRERQAGFTVFELLVAAALGSLALGGLLLFAGRLGSWTSSLDGRIQAQSAAARLLERLSTEAASAWAVYVPATDVFGNANADGHEIDFFSEDGSHRPYQWAYSFDARRKLVTRYAVAGDVTAGEEIGPFDSLRADTIDVTQIGAADPLFAGANATPVTYAFPASPAARGGNALVRVHITAKGVERSELLASATAPTTFTVIIQYTPSPAPASTGTPPPLGPMTTPTP